MDQSERNTNLISALAVFKAVIDRVRAGEWAQGFWGEQIDTAGRTRCCLHTMLDREIVKRRSGNKPTYLDQVAFSFVWDCLPLPHCRISTFNDDPNTRADDVVALLGAASVNAILRTYGLELRDEVLREMRCI